MRDYLKIIFVTILRAIFSLHVFLYRLSVNKLLIDADIAIISNKRSIHFTAPKALVYILYTDKYYRNIFYNRLGKLSLLCSWMMPRAKDFFPCENIGGGVYPAHPFSTILNAKKIGDNFSFRQCTTIGNKKDGEVSCPTIGDNVTLGANVCIIGDVTIGNNVIIGAGAVVVKNIPDNVIVAGNPAHIIKEINLL